MDSGVSEKYTVKNGSQEILNRLKEGDAEAFDIIYKQYYRGLFAFATQYVNRAECEEIIQDVMMWVWENHTMLIPELSLKSLLFASVKNRCLNKIAHIQYFRYLYPEYDTFLRIVLFQYFLSSL